MQHTLNSFAIIALTVAVVVLSCMVYRLSIALRLVTERLRDTTSIAMIARADLQMLMGDYKRRVAATRSLDAAIASRLDSVPKSFSSSDRIDGGQPR